MNKLKKVLRWGAISIVGFFILIIIVAIASPVTSVENENTETAIANISEENSENQTPIVHNSPEQTPIVETKILSENSTNYKVISVVDGDTIKVDIDGKIETIRIIGLNTPETVDPRKSVECFGKEASNKAKELLLGKTVILEKDSSQGERDKYNRLLRYVFISDGYDFGKTMIAEGYAYEYTYNSAYKYQKVYKEAQVTAQSMQKGLWSPNACNIPSISNSTTTTTTGKYYASSASNATRYYPENCSAWQDLSKANLRSFDSLDELLTVYPDRTLADACK